jgi:hypothetical protein
MDGKRYQIILFFCHRRNPLFFQLTPIAVIYPVCRLQFGDRRNGYATRKLRFIGSGQRSKDGVFLELRRDRAPSCRLEKNSRKLLGFPVAHRLRRLYVHGARKRIDHVPGMKGGEAK